MKIEGVNQKSLNVLDEGAPQTKRWNNKRIMSYTKLAEKIEQKVETMPIVARKIISFALDIFSFMVLAVTFPFSLQKLCDPKNDQNSAIDRSQPPVLLIHGFLGRSNHMLYHRKKLQDSGLKNVFTVDLGHPFHSIEEYAQEVSNRMRAIQEITGRSDVIVVGHSMGGLVADAYRRLHSEKDGITVLDTITVGTPLKGTKIAALADLFSSKAGAQMRPTSLFSLKREMQRGDLPDKGPEASRLHIGSEDDTIVPYDSSIGAPEGTETGNIQSETIRVGGHGWQLFSPRVNAIIYERIQQTKQSLIEKNTNSAHGEIT